MTLFAGTPETEQFSLWDKVCGFNGSDDAMRARILENATALESTPTTPINLGYLENAYSKTEPDISEMADNVEARADSEACFIVAGGIGSYRRKHPDHITTRQVGSELAQRGREVMYYADLPYALPIRNFNNWPARINTSALQQLLGQTVEIVPIELSNDHQLRKRAAIEAYSSQFTMVNLLALGALKRPKAYKWEVLFKARREEE